VFGITAINTCSFPSLSVVIMFSIHRIIALIHQYSNYQETYNECRLMTIHTFDINIPARRMLPQTLVNKLNTKTWGGVTVTTINNTISCVVTSYSLVQRYIYPHIFLPWWQRLQVTSKCFGIPTRLNPPPTLKKAPPPPPNPPYSQ